MEVSINSNVDNVKCQQQMKVKYGDNVVVLFRAGDTYRSFNEDADTVAKVTGVSIKVDGAYRMAEFHHQGLDIYLPMLVRRGHRMAIIDEKRN